MWRVWPGLCGTMFKGFLVSYYTGFILASLPNPDVGFGLTSPAPIQAGLLNKVIRESFSQSRGRRRKVGLCHQLGLRGRQRHLCELESGISGTLATSVVQAVVQCKHQFYYERWNCSPLHKVNTLRKGFKETAFMYAVTSASLVHSFSRACAMGTLQRCTCDSSKKPQKILKENWKWGACGDNVQYGQKFTKKFLNARENEEDLRGKVDLHNSNVGIKIIRDGLQVRCKCFGVSGSCAAKTCWRQLSTFQEIGRKLKKKYNRASLVVLSANQVTRQSHLVVQPDRTLVASRNMERDLANSHQKRDLSSLGKRDLAYLEKSPSFCRRTKYSAGVYGRLCKNRKSCDDFCCGLGYNVKAQRKARACNCRMEGEGCCNVKCDTCYEDLEIFVCKEALETY